uniref:Uncharacterized protein n=1 Tax=Rhizophora mucronata TaxID=61149 RepID=A0A2P2PL77_RHIMU
MEDRKMLKEELALLRRGMRIRRVHVGFPLLFVLMVALVSLLLGYMLHP